MASMELTTDTVHVRLTGWEKAASLHGDLAIPRSAITGTRVSREALREVKGFRAPGLGMPGLKCMGTFRKRSGNTFAIARRGEPAVVLTVPGGEFVTVVVGGVVDPEAVAQELDFSAN